MNFEKMLNDLGKEIIQLKKQVRELSEENEQYRADFKKLFEVNKTVEKTLEETNHDSFERLLLLCCLLNAKHNINISINDSKIDDVTIENASNPI